jgi:hypothetical protein
MPVPPHPEVCCLGPLGSGDGRRMPSTSKGQARCHVDTTTRSQNQLHRLVPTHQVLELDAVQP